MKKHITCLQCGTSFEVAYKLGDQGSLNSCKRKYCSRECKKLFNKNNATSTKKVEIKCQQCRSEFFRPLSQSHSAKFCSKTCRDESTKKKCKVCIRGISSRIRDGICYDCRLKQRRIQHVCKLCGKNWSDLPSVRKKFCTRSCQWKAQSSGLMKLSTHGRTGFRTDLNDGNYYKSSLEADFARLCRHKNEEYLYEAKTFETTIDGK